MTPRHLTSFLTHPIFLGPGPYGAPVLIPPGSGPKGPHAGVFVCRSGMPLERAAVFVDGNNWYHAMKRAKLTGLGWLNYAKVSVKLVGAREWVATRYYVGRVQQTPEYSKLYADQRQYMSWLESRDKRISIHYGRLETHTAENDFAHEVKTYLANLKVRIDATVYKHLVSEANRHRTSSVVVEKAVDVALAVDMVRMADRDQYDVAYLLAADGDYTPAVEAVKETGKKVFAAALEPGAQLAAAVYKFIPLKPDWLTECFRA